MTAGTRFERELPALLEDLYLGPSPDYRDEVMAAAVRSRQRPSWTFAGRWFPMADIATRPMTAPRVPLRAAALALIVIALLLAVAALIVGSTHPRLPKPFGLAANGLITYDLNGDIYTVDPTTGVTTAIVPGPEQDAGPVFSPDGTRIAFHRSHPIDGAAADDLVVVASNGSKPVVITADPIRGGVGRYEWAPDSKTLLVNAADDSAIWSLDTTTTSSPRTVTTGAVFYTRPFQPPERHVDPDLPEDRSGRAHRLCSISPPRTRSRLARAAATTPVAARWSPDGSQVVYNAVPADDPLSQRLFIVNADGTNTRQITHAPGNWFDIDATWSPDGTLIAFTRYQQLADGTYDVRPTGIYSVATGKVIDAGPLPRDARAQQPTPADASASRGEGFALEWSPDSKSLIAFPSEASGHPVVINPADGTWRILDPVLDPGLPMQSWQRKAP